jgi:Uroporphyrinogen decarboxylase (URO-D)
MSQLVSYIAPAAPATRRPASGNEPFLRPEVGFTPAWYRSHLDIDFGQRWHCDVTYRRSTVLAMRRLLQEHFPETGIATMGSDDSPLDLLTGVFGAIAVSRVFNCEPVWAQDNWPNVHCPPISLQQASELEPPNLDNNPFFQTLMSQLDAIESLQRQVVGFINWQGVINNAQRLRGQDVFIDLIESPDTCHNLFQVICETMIDAIRRLHARQSSTGVDYHFATVSNCTVNMLSPDHYREFLLPYDRRIASSFETVGIHNCAWKADPYLNDYASIPNVGYIDMGLDSDLARARELFPNARRAVMYTPMDLASKSKSAIHADFERIATDYGPCDIVIADIEAGVPDDRVKLALKLCKVFSDK